MRHFLFSKGFTLIELLVVIAVTGVLAGGTVVAINPLEKIAQAKDSTKKTTVSQLASALQSYYTMNAGKYPAMGGTWIDGLVAGGEMKSVPPPAGGTPCTPAANNQNGYCFQTNIDRTEAVVYASLETSQRPSGTSGTTAYQLWSSTSGQSGTYYSLSGDVSPTQEITFGQNSTLTQGLVGWWKMNGNADDSSGNGNNGIIAGASLTVDKNGYFDKAYSFNGTNNYADLGAANAFNPGTGVVTWGAWFKTSSSGTEQHIIDFQGGTGWDGNGRLSLYKGGNNRLYAYTIKQVGTPYYSTAIASNATVNNGQWHHGLLIWDFPSKTIKLYLDGIYQGSNSNTNITQAPNTQSGRKLSIGVQHYANGNTYFFNGLVDDVRVYNRALSSAEIQNLFSAGPQ